jgi:abhydrolase domain-containing protein 6
MKKSLAILACVVAIVVASFALSDKAKLHALNAAMWFEEKLASMKEKSVIIGDHEVVYLVREGNFQDAETIILFHGFTAEKNNWPRFTRHINHDFRVIAIDWPAHGESTFLEGGDYTLSNQADRLSDFMEKLGIEKAHLVGNSMGGAIAANFASRHPSKVETLTLMNSGGADNPDTESEIEIAMRQGKNPLLVKEPKEFQRAFGLAMEKPPFLPWPIGDAMANVAAERYTRFLTVFKQVHGGVTNREYGYLRQIQAPTLIMWGTNDRILDVGNAQIFSAEIPNSKTIIYEGVGHMPMLEVPAQSAADIVQFIESHRK